MALHVEPRFKVLNKMSPTNRQVSKKPQRRFQFIDNSNIGASGANSTQVRRHVMQEYMREKRWESRARVEGEVLDPPARQSPDYYQQTVSTLRTAHPRPRSNHQASSAVQKPDTAPSPDATAPVVPAPKYQQSLSNPTRPARPKRQSAEKRPESLVPATQQKCKSPQPGFHLTSQSFASIADFSEVLSSTPGSTITTSARSLSASLTSRTASKSPEPSSLLSAARTDPFDCLPVTLGGQDQELFDFYATVMPACSYGFERRSPRAHNWYHLVFIPEAMKSPVAFQNTVLVHAANTQAWVRGLPETPLSLEHRARASKMLFEHFQQFPHDTSDAAISSTLSAAALEDFDSRPERRKYAWMHWHAAMQKIRDRGGPAALEQNVSLRMLINWSDYIFSGYHGFGSTFFFDHKSSVPYANEAEAESIARNEIRQQCEEFIVFLKCAESLALVAANMQANRSARNNQEMRYSAFEPGQPLYKLLASPNSPRYTTTGQLKQTISRLAALMTINVAVWEYRYSTRACESFFHELLQNIRYNELERHDSVEALLQILLTGSEDPELFHTERPWLVGRLLKVAKRLSRKSWERLNDFLLQCLTLGPSLNPAVENWEHELRTEILDAALTSYALPIMQPT